jgi:histidyl-tRNA synthetase
MNGALSSSIAAALMTIALTTRINHVPACGSLGAGPARAPFKDCAMPSKLAAPRGTQDIFPPQSGRWQELEARIHALARRYGYGEIRTPIFESTDLFVRGVGETSDIVEKEMYTFADKGERSMTLRPEWTAPVVRAALQHGLFTQGPQRLYYLGPIFRYERPQAGRYRQSNQFGIECAGYAEPEADAEVITLAWDLLQVYAIGGVMLRLNSIGDETCRPKYRDALRAHFLPHRDSLSADSQRRLERNPLRVLDSKAPEDQTLVASAPRFEKFLCDDCRAHFEGVKLALEAAGVPYTVDARIVRGLDYYTRTVFEFVSDALGAQSTICAGGRYDQLVGSLGGPDVPAVGFALGLERFLSAVESAGTSEEARREGVQAIAIGSQALQALLPLVTGLRRKGGGPVFIDYGDRKLLAQLKTADRNNARYALILGEKELAEGSIVLRDLVTRMDRPLPFGKDTLEALGELKG